MCKGACCTCQVSLSQESAPLAEGVKAAGTGNLPDDLQDGKALMVQAHAVHLAEQAQGGAPASQIRLLLICSIPTSLSNQAAALC